MDREKIIDHLQIIHIWAAVGKDPIYNGIEPKCCEDIEKWTKDALDLLKDQEPISPGIKQDCRGISYVCGACGATLYTIADTASAEYKIKHGRFCPECGRSVKFA